MISKTLVEGKGNNMVIVAASYGKRNPGIEKNNNIPIRTMVMAVPRETINSVVFVSATRMRKRTYCAAGRVNAR